MMTIKVTVLFLSQMQKIYLTYLLIVIAKIEIISMIAIENII